MEFPKGDKSLAKKLPGIVLQSLTMNINFSLTFDECYSQEGLIFMAFVVFVYTEAVCMLASRLQQAVHRPKLTSEAYKNSHPERKG